MTAGAAVQVLAAPAVLLDGALVPDGWVAHDRGSIVDDPDHQDS